MRNKGLWSPTSSVYIFSNAIELLFRIFSGVVAEQYACINATVNSLIDT